MKQLELFENQYDNDDSIYENAFDWAFEFPQLCDENGNFEGFDVIVGNPPYIPLKKLPYIKKIKNKYETYTANGDIYTLFIERGLQILRPDGKLCMITSNKWLRAAYGESLRGFLLKNTSIDKLIDFDGLQVFDEASVDTNIIFLTKHKNGKQPIEAVRFDKTFHLEKDSIADYFEKHRILLSDLSSDSWNFASDNEKLIKQKLISKGTNLENWKIEINRGVLTGYNEAFFIDKETRNILIKNNKKNSKIISPLLRGRDVHNYYIDKQNRYLINTYNGKLVKKYDANTEKYYRERIDRIDVEKDYPAIFEYLKQFENELRKRDDQGEHWTNHRNCAYQNLFFQEKIIYPETTGRRSEFFLDTENFMIDKTCFMITGENLKFLLGVLNSKLIEFYFENEGRLIGQSAIQYSKQYIEKIPIPLITDDNIVTVSKIEKLVNLILEKKEKDKQVDISKETDEIDKLVYQLYDLTDEEIKIVEK